jgi:hypothetical protein
MSTTLRSGGLRYIAQLAKCPGSTIAEVAEALDRPRNDACKRLLSLRRSGHVVHREDDGVGRYWIAEERDACAAWVPPPPTAAPKPLAATPGRAATPNIAAARVGQLHPERVEMRIIDGRLVKYTICPRAVEPEATLLHAPARVRVNLSSKWGAL